MPSKRIEALRKLQDAGFDVAIRLSPLIEEYMDFDKLNGLGINKAVVEFLRINHWIERWFGIDYSRYTLREGGYRHLPLDEKRRILQKITIPNVTVCEDVLKHYYFWSQHVNPNPDVRLGGYDAIQSKDPMQTSRMSESRAGGKEVL